MILSLYSRILLILISFALLIPVAAIPLQNTQSLEQFHNRKLAQWPLGDSFMRDPAAYFTNSKKWLADRAFPIIQATMFQKNFLLFALDTPPQRRVTMGGDGFIFLNGPEESKLNEIFQIVCIRAHTADVVSNFRNSLTSVASFSQKYGVPVDIVVVPTVETLYGDRLPLSVPNKYRAACGERAVAASPLSQIEAPPGVNYIFPFREMKAAREDAAFFPKGNWHPNGLSMKVVRDAYLAKLSISGEVSETLERTTAPSELLLSYGIYKYLPIYKITNSNLVVDNDTNTSLHSLVSDLFTVPRVITHAYRNSHPVDERTVLMVSDSFGDLAAPVFAGAFRRFLHVTSNDMRQDQVVELISRVAKLAHIDRVVILIQEGGTDRVVGYGQEFGKFQATAAGVDN
jgi:hypothetical protein